MYHLQLHELPLEREMHGRVGVPVRPPRHRRFWRDRHRRSLPPAFWNEGPKGGEGPTGSSIPNLKHVPATALAQHSGPGTFGHRIPFGERMRFRSMDALPNYRAVKPPLLFFFLLLPAFFFVLFSLAMQRSSLSLMGNQGTTGDMSLRAMLDLDP